VVTRKNASRRPSTRKPRSSLKPAIASRSIPQAVTALVIRRVERAKRLRAISPKALSHPMARLHTGREERLSEQRHRRCPPQAPR
jgi:hypothetical protein